MCFESSAPSTCVTKLCLAEDDTSPPSLIITLYYRISFSCYLISNWLWFGTLTNCSFFPQRPHMLDPRKTWDFFLRNSEAQRARSRKNRMRNRKNRIPMPKEGPPGPPGRRGPVGPPGAPGGTLTTQEMEEYIKDFLRGQNCTCFTIS